MKEGYYWYQDVDVVDGRGTPVEFGEWDIVKLQLYSSGYDKRYTKELKLKSPVLMMSFFNQKYLTEVKKAKGLFGKKIANLKE